MSRFPPARGGARRATVAAAGETTGFRWRDRKGGRRSCFNGSDALACRLHGRRRDRDADAGPGDGARRPEHPARGSPCRVFDHTRQLCRRVLLGCGIGGGDLCARRRIADRLPRSEGDRSSRPRRARCPGVAAPGRERWPPACDAPCVPGRRCHLARESEARGLLHRALSAVPLRRSFDAEQGCADGLPDRRARPGLVFGARSDRRAGPPRARRWTPDAPPRACPRLRDDRPGLRLALESRVCAVAAEPQIVGLGGHGDTDEATRAFLAHVSA